MVLAASSLDDTLSESKLGRVEEVGLGKCGRRWDLRWRRGVKMFWR